jgi:hypothetical protein
MDARPVLSGNLSILDDLASRGGNRDRIRKTIILRERTVFSELGVKANRPTTRAVGTAVIRNPFAGTFVEDLKAGRCSESG